jgi:hypothetical protein
VVVTVRSPAGPQYSSQMLAQMDLPKHASVPRFSMTTFLGPLSYAWLLQLTLPWTVVLLVYEKQRRLRLMMRMHGLPNSVPLSPVVPDRPSQRGTSQAGLQACCCLS